MSESFWYVVELVGFILAGAMLVLNIILFIRLQVPLLIGELSGKRLKKEVKQIRDSYVDYDKRNQVRRQAAERRESAIPNPIEQMSQKEWKPTVPPNVNPKQTEESSEWIPKGVTASGGQGTEALDWSRGTEPLHSNKGTEVISGTETMILDEPARSLEHQEVTSVLQPDSKFQLVRELILTHTDERLDGIYRSIV